jgi:cyclophilin family peptidyl-prolyl cis-trans isomerase
MNRLTAALVALVLVGATGNLWARQAAPPATARGTAPAQRQAPVAAGPVVVFETAQKGSFEIEMYPNEAPKTVEHILALVKRNFYNGQRVHRMVPGFVVQWGDPLSRDYTRRDRWGSGGSGKPIGVAEINPKRTHRIGAVAAAHPGDPRMADSQIYVVLAPTPRLDRDFTVFGQVVSGMDVVRKLEVGDVIRRATVKGAVPARGR